MKTSNKINSNLKEDEQQLRIRGTTKKRQTTKKIWTTIENKTNNN